jgi:hypothetical protein
MCPTNDVEEGPLFPTISKNRAQLLYIKRASQLSQDVSQPFDRNEAVHRVGRRGVLLGDPYITGKLVFSWQCMQQPLPSLKLPRFA